MHTVFKKTSCSILALFLLLVTIQSHTIAAESAGTTRIATGIVFQQLFIDPEGMYVCVFGQAPLSKHRITSSFSGPPNQLVVIDLQKGKVIARCPIVGEVRTALVDDSQILWAPSNTNILYRLRFNGPDRPEGVVLDAAVEQIFGLGPEMFGMVSAAGRSEGIVSISKRKTLEKVEAHPLAGMPVRLVSRNLGGPIIPLGDSMAYLNGRVINLSDGTNRCFTIKQRRPPRIDGQTRQINFPSHDSLGDTYWRRTFRRASEVSQFAGTGKIRILSSWNWISQTHPLLVSLGFVPDRRNHVAKLYVELQDLVHGQVLKRIELPDPVTIEGHRPPHGQTAIRIGGDTVVTVVWDELFITKLPKRNLAEGALDPLRLLYPEIPILDVQKSLRFQLTALGGKPPLRFGLASEVPGVTINRSTGKVMIDYSVGWQRFCERIAKSTYYNTGPSSLYINGMFFSDFFGTKANDEKMFVSLPVEFTVSDRSGQKDRIFVSLIAQAPKDQYNKAKQASKDLKGLGPKRD